MQEAKCEHPETLNHFKRAEANVCGQKNQNIEFLMQTTDATSLD